MKTIGNFFVLVGADGGPGRRIFVERSVAARPRVRFATSVILLVIGCAISSRAETIALWLFDEPLAPAPETVLADAGPRNFFLTLARGGEIVPGRFGHALRPAAVNQSPNLFEAGLPRAAAILSTRNAPRVSNPLDSKLNLGADDWTIECWLRLDGRAAEEAVILEIGSGRPGATELRTRFSVLPAENAFAFAGIASGPARGVGVKPIEFPNPSGPPQGLAHPAVSTLALTGAALPRDRWTHVALVHRRAERDLRLFLDGRLRGVAAAALETLPHDDEAYLAIGSDGAGRCRLAGAIDELRICDDRVYHAEFVPPASLAARDDSGRAGR